MATDNFARILALKAKSAAEATSYSDLTNKPSINDVVLNGNLSLEDLGLNAIWIGTSAEYAEIASSLEDGTLVVITDDQDIDNVPTQSSTNLVYSGGVYTFVAQGLSNKVDKETGKGLSTEDYTTAEKLTLASLDSQLGDISLVQCTQAEYDAMSEHDQNTLYIVIDSGGE